MDEKYLRDLKDLEDKNRCLCKEMTQLTDEREKLRVQYEQALKDNAELEKSIEYLSGKVAAYEYVLSKMKNI